MADRSKIRTYSLWIAIALVVLYVGAGGAAKLASVPYVHSSFPKLPSDIRSAGEMGTFPIPRSTKFMRSPYKSDSSPPHYWISVGLSH